LEVGIKVFLWGHSVRGSSSNLTISTKANNQFFVSICWQCARYR